MPFVTNLADAEHFSQLTGRAIIACKGSTAAHNSAVACTHRIKLFFVAFHCWLDLCNCPLDQNFPYLQKQAIADLMCPRISCT